jgi:hypothetical protein
MKWQPDLFGKPVLERRASVAADAVFFFGSRPLKVVSSHGTDAAAPVIVEELTDAKTLKGQLGLWALDGVRRRMR